MLATFLKILVLIYRLDVEMCMMARGLMAENDPTGHRNTVFEVG